MEYSYAMNGLLLQEGLTRPPLRDKVRAELLLPPAPPPVPELGVIEIADNTFVDASVPPPPPLHPEKKSHVLPCNLHP